MLLLVLMQFQIDYTSSKLTFPLFGLALFLIQRMSHEVSLNVYSNSFVPFLNNQYCISYIGSINNIYGNKHPKHLACLEIKDGGAVSEAKTAFLKCFSLYILIDLICSLENVITCFGLVKT